MQVFDNLTPHEEEQLKSIAREKCREDLHFLAKEILGYHRITDHIHKKMARDIDTPRYRFRLLLWPRGHFKSTLGTESYPIQRLLRDPNERLLITNAKLENSRKFLRTIANQFHSNAKFRWLWRGWWINSYANEYDRASMRDKLDWVVRDVQDELTLLRPYAGREASITTGAVDASLVSQHYSTIIADDLVNREFVRTIDMVEKSILYFKDLLDLLDPDGELLIIGTRWSHMDLYGWLIQEFGHKASIRVPKDIAESQAMAQVIERGKETPEDEKDWMISIMPTKVSAPIFPEEYGSKELQALLEAKGPYEYGAQYELDPTPAEHQKFKEEWFQALDVMPDPGNLEVCITVDPAKSLEDQADNSAIAVCGYDESNWMYLLDGLNEKLTPDELLEALFGIVQKWTSKAKFVLPVGFEAVGFQEIYIYNLERMMLERDFFFGIEPIKRRNMSKEQRILRLVPRLKNGFYVPRKLDINPYSGRGQPYDLVQRLKWELLKFPFAGTDDLADALADQLDIVKAHRLPVEEKPREPQVKRDFIHPSVLEDKRRMRRQKAYRYNDAVR